MFADAGVLAALRRHTLPSPRCSGDVMSSDVQLVPGQPATDEAARALRQLGINAPNAAATTPLGELLVARGDLSGQQLRDALSAQTSEGRRLGEILVELGVISERALSSALAQQLGLET